MPGTSSSDSVEDVALRFLKAYWNADLSRALAACAPAATIALPPSAPFASPAPIELVLPQIFSQVYSRFVDRRFEVTVERSLASNSTAIVEYTARGDLVTGDRFVCRYLAVLEIENGKVCGWRPYTDTKYVAEKLL